MKRQKPKPTFLYELWQDAEGYVLLPANSAERDQILKPPAKLIIEIAATDWDDAKRQRDQYLYPKDPRDPL